MTAIPALMILTQENSHDFETSLDYIEGHYLKEL